MRRAPVLLLIACASIAHAGPIHRCETGGGHISYQDGPCMELAAYAPAAMADPFAARADEPYDPEARSPRRIQADFEAQVIAARMQNLSARASNLRSADHAQNLDRCRSAMQVAALCGTAAPAFACSDRGFVAAPPGDASGPATVSKYRKIQMQRCARQAKKGGP